MVHNSSSGTQMIKFEKWDGVLNTGMAIARDIKDAEKAQQAMSSLSPESIDKMLWVRFWRKNEIDPVEEKPAVELLKKTRKPMAAWLSHLPRAPQLKIIERRSGKASVTDTEGSQNQSMSVVKYIDRGFRRGPISHGAHDHCFFTKLTEKEVFTEEEQIDLYRPTVFQNQLYTGCSKDRMIKSLGIEARKSEGAFMLFQETQESVRVSFLNCLLDFAGMERGYLEQIGSGLTDYAMPPINIFKVFWLDEPFWGFWCSLNNHRSKKEIPKPGTHRYDSSIAS
ncbi:hypothetical protein LXL04_028854 [Taraxacum kok-saghyz]